MPFGSLRKAITSTAPIRAPNGALEPVPDLQSPFLQNDIKTNTRLSSPRRLHNSSPVQSRPNPLRTRPPKTIRQPRLTNLNPTLLPPTHNGRPRNTGSRRCQDRPPHKHNPHQAPPKLRKTQRQTRSQSRRLHNRQPPNR